MILLIETPYRSPPVGALVVFQFPPPARQALHIPLHARRRPVPPFFGPNGHGPLGKEAVDHGIVVLRFAPKVSKVVLAEDVLVWGVAVPGAVVRRTTGEGSSLKPDRFMWKQYIWGVLQQVGHGTRKCMQHPTHKHHQAKLKAALHEAKQLPKSNRSKSIQIQKGI